MRSSHEIVAGLFSGLALSIHSGAVVPRAWAPWKFGAAMRRTALDENGLF